MHLCAEEEGLQIFVLLNHFKFDTVSMVSSDFIWKLIYFSRTVFTLDCSIFVCVVENKFSTFQIFSDLVTTYKTRFLEIFLRTALHFFGYKIYSIESFFFSFFKIFVLKRILL